MEDQSYQPQDPHGGETTKCRPFGGEAEKTLEIWKYVVLLVVLLELQCWSLTTEDLDRAVDVIDLM